VAQAAKFIRYAPKQRKIAGGSAMTAPLLEVEGLKVAYHHNAVALHGVSLSVMPQAIAAILGINGAGKTTTLRAISGFIGLDDASVVAGSIHFAGERIENRPPHANAARGIVLVPERDKVFPNLTVTENLTASSSARANAGERRRLEETVFAFFPALVGLRSRLAGLLSGGERQMLAIGSALLCNPQLLLVDELSLGLAPVVVEDLARRLAAMRAELGITVLLVEQNANVALTIADYGYILESGRVVLEGAAAELRGRREVQEAYLGQTGGAERRSYRALPLGSALSEGRRE
jgi:branched-chain amino acid transport system ATP-binding protein